MMRRLWCGLLAAGLWTGAASAQDFIDDQFQILDPHLTLSVFRSFDTNQCGSNLMDMSSFVCQGDFLSTGHVQGAGIDAAGNFYDVSFELVVTGLGTSFCPTASGADTTYIFMLKRRSLLANETIARVPLCVFVPGGTQYTYVLNLAVDGTNGHLYVAVASTAPGFVNPRFAIVRISGLPTLLDIIPTFTPTTGTLSWVTPKHPEALPAADRFQVYTGDLAALRADRGFGSAVPINCSVPGVGAPNPGDFLSIVDPLPDPVPGQGSYAVVGVQYGVQRRFGRQNMGGILSGRDPGLFRACS